VAVFGVPDRRYGEELMACVRLAGGASLEEDDVRDYCRGRIAHFKVPRYVRFVDEFPMTVTGKVQKFKMRDAAVDELGLAEEVGATA
jgi:fatty-acyl-CoA synthase